MTFNRYYQDELAALRDLGREFAEANPALAPYLAERGTDPDVERLLEGFAFLTGRLRQRLDDELPELAHSLLSLVYPGALRPLPSATIMAFTPLAGVLAEVGRVPAATELEAIPVDGVRCPFRTTAPLDLVPAEVKDVVHRRAGRHDLVEVRIRFQPGVEPRALGIDALRFHLHGEPSVACTLLLALVEHLEGASVAVDDSEEFRPLPNDAVRLAPLDVDRAVLPAEPRLFDGFRILQDYVCLPEALQFIDVRGLGPAMARATGALRLRFLVARPLADHERPRAETIRLNCVPAVNLFALDADPLRIDPGRADYRLRPGTPDHRHVEIFSIDEVGGRTRGDARVLRFRPFETFATTGPEEQVGLYRVRLGPGVASARTEAYLRFVDRADADMVPVVETVSVRLTCCHLGLPDKLRAGDIRLSTSSSPEFATFANLDRPSAPAPAPIGQGIVWHLISNLALNYASLTDAHGLRRLLDAYNPRVFVDRGARAAHERRVAGIESCRTEPFDVLHRGRPLRGYQTTLTLLDNHFAGIGDMYLFASVLERLLRLCISVNCVHRLRLEARPSAEVYEWPTVAGPQPML